MIEVLNPWAIVGRISNQYVIMLTLQQIFADQVGYKLEQFRRSLVRTLKMIPGA